MGRALLARAVVIDGRPAVVPSGTLPAIDQGGAALESAPGHDGSCLWSVVGVVDTGARFGTALTYSPSAPNPGPSRRSLTTRRFAARCAEIRDEPRTGYRRAYVDDDCPALAFASP